MRGGERQEAMTADWPRLRPIRALGQAVCPTPGALGTPSASGAWLRSVLAAAIPPPSQLGRADFMQAAAALLPLLLIALILERRWTVIPDALRGGTTGRAIELTEAALDWGISILLLIGEYVALASLGRPYTTRGDQHFVGVIAVIAAILLLMPILVSRAWTATSPAWSPTSRLTVALILAVAGYFVAWLIIELVAP
jgi:hypothetical protein